MDERGWQFAARARDSGSRARRRRVFPPTDRRDRKKLAKASGGRIVFPEDAGAPRRFYRDRPLCQEETAEFGHDLGRSHAETQRGRVEGFAGKTVDEAFHDLPDARGDFWLLSGGEERQAGHVVLVLGDVPCVGVGISCRPFVGQVHPGDRLQEHEGDRRDNGNAIDFRPVLHHEVIIEVVEENPGEAGCFVADRDGREVPGHVRRQCGGLSGEQFHHFRKMRGRGMGETVELAGSAGALPVAVGALPDELPEAPEKGRRQRFDAKQHVEVPRCPEGQGDRRKMDVAGAAANQHVAVFPVGEKAEEGAQSFYHAKFSKSLSRAIWTRSSRSSRRDRANERVSILPSPSIVGG